MAEDNTTATALEAVSARNPTSNRQPRRKSKQSLILISDPSALEMAWRGWDDLPEHVPINGFSAKVISVLGYKYAVNGCAFPVKIPRRSVVVAVRNPAGRIVSLHDGKGTWFCPKSLHFANLRRIRSSGQLEIFSNTIQADVEAERRNIAAVGLNGLTFHDLQLATAHLNVKLIAGNDWRLAA